MVCEAAIVFFARLLLNSAHWNRSHISLSSSLIMEYSIRPQREQGTIRSGAAP